MITKEHRAMSSAEEFDLISSRISEACDVLRAMANETRLKILCALGDGEKSVNELADLTGQSLPAVSQHLAKLRASSLVESRREAQTIYYRCAQGAGRVLITSLCDFYSD